MTLLALLILAGPQQDASPIVSAEFRAARASEVVGQLGAKVGLKLDVAPSIANEVLLIKAKDVSRDVLLAKIANVVSGQWTADGDTLRLTPNAGVWGREQQAKVAQQLAAIKKDLNTRLNPPKPPAGSDTAAASEEMAMMGDYGGDNVVLKLLAGIDLAPIASLKSGERIVYSTAPTRMQRAMGGNASALITKSIKEHNDMVANIPQSTDPKTDAMMDQMPEYVKAMMKKQTEKIVDPQKALLVVSRSQLGTYATTQVELRVYNSKGEVVMSTPSVLSSDMAAMMEAMKDDKKPKAPSDKPVTYSEDSKQIQDINSSGALAMTKTLSKAVADKLSHPSVNEPLSFMATDELFSVAVEKGKALVADIPDSAMIEQRGMGSGATTISAVIAKYGPTDEAMLTETNGWIVVKPVTLAETRDNRVNRVALEKLVAQSREKVVASLDDIAAFSLTSPSPMENSVEQIYASMFIPGLVQMGLGGMTNWDAIRFYGTLSSSQRDGLSTGGNLSYGLMNQGQKSIWNRIVFGTSGHIALGEPKAEKADPFEAMMSAFGGMSGGTDYRQEPTELLANGISNNAYLTINRDSSPFASASTPGESNLMGGYFGALGVDEMAMLKMFKEEPSMAQVSAQIPGFDKLRVGTRISYAMRLHLSPEASVTQSVDDNRMPKDAPIVTMDTLPADFQKLLAERMAALKKSPLGMFGGMMGGMGGTIKP